MFIDPSPPDGARRGCAAVGELHYGAYAMWLCQQPCNSLRLHEATSLGGHSWLRDIPSRLSHTRTWDDRRLSSDEELNIDTPTLARAWR